MRCPAFVVTLALAGTCSGQHIARDFEPRISIGGGVGFQAANVVGGTYESERAIPWPGAQVEAGVSLTYRDRIGVGIAGGWGFTGYVLWPIDSVCYDIYHTAPRVEARLFWLFPCGIGCESLKRLGLAFGYSYQQADVLRSTEQGLEVVTTAPRMDRPYIAPELGLFGSEGKHRLEVSLRYVAYLDPTPAWTSTVQGAGGEATYNGSDDQLALVLRYHIGFGRRPVPTLPMPEVAMATRDEDTLATFTTVRSRITMRLWDNAEYDGDTISVLLNDEPVLVAHELTKKPMRIALDLRSGWNTVRVVAHNEGRVPPNTASCTIRRGKGKEELLVRTSNGKNTTLVIRKE